MSKNKELSSIFNKIADALEFKGEMSFKVSAYRKAARIIHDLPEPIEKVWEEGRLREIPGIGEGISKKIDEYLRTGKMKKYEESIEGVPQDLLNLLNVQSVGIKTIKLAYDKLGVKTIEDFRRVVEDGSLGKLPGMGEKKIENIKKGLSFYSSEERRISIGVALPLAEEVISWLNSFGVDKISPAGSLRRMKETVGDIDILVGSDNGEEVISHFTKFPGAVRVLVQGTTKGSIIVSDGYQIDLRVVPLSSFGAALQYFTGSKAHNIKLRTIARSRGLKISEYGVFKGEEKIAGDTEEGVYAALGLPCFPPEIREDMGEIELKDLPNLVEYDSIKGDLHIHSKYSDGAHSIKEIALFAKQMGYKYIAITDHSKSAKYASGIDELSLEKQSIEIDNVEKEVGIKIYKGIEVEIKRDGSLDFSDEVLSKLDIVIGAIHTFPKEMDMTPALIKVCQNPNVDVIAHPTGRLISRREGYKVDLEKLFRVASETKTVLEINCYYDRLDLSDTNARISKNYGMKFLLGSDAHNLGMLSSIRFGVGLSRRAWLSKEEIINTYDEPLKLLKYIK